MGNFKCWNVLLVWIIVRQGSSALAVGVIRIGPVTGPLLLYWPTAFGLGPIQKTSDP